MKNSALTLLLFLLAGISIGQVDEIEQWRDLGYQSKRVDNYPNAISYYLKVLELDPEDYDAKLALGRLYIITEDYRTAIGYFEEIYRKDSTDVEALNGLGESYGMMGEDKKSVHYYERAHAFLPDDVPQLFYLAKAYGNAGKLDEAIDAYLQVNAIDDTYSEAWAGIGKMYYWMQKPKTAMAFYDTALVLDPGNEEIIKEYQDVKSELQPGLTVSFGPVREIEENYEINALVSKVKLEKRLNDHFQAEANILLDYSSRVFSDNNGDTTRWYNSTWIKGSWITRHHHVSIYGGYSNTDNLFSTYGLNWKLNYSAGKLTFKNSLNAGYDYFYYWNSVGAKSLAEEINLGLGILGFRAGLSVGIVDPVYVTSFIPEDTSGIRKNPFQTYSLSLTFKVLKRPEIKLGLNHSWLNYKYKSQLYYSPFDRILTGASASVYYTIKKLYVYGSFSYNLGTEYNFEEKNSGQMKRVKMNVDNWSSNIELGYNHYPFSFSIGASNFNNPYYQNLTGFISVKILF